MKESMWGENTIYNQLYLPITHLKSEECYEYGKRIENGYYRNAFQN